MAKDKVNKPDAKAKQLSKDTGKLPSKGKDAKDTKQISKDAKDKQQKATAKPARRGKLGYRIDRIVKYFREMIAELKKATWPSKKDLAKYTGIVLAFVTILAVVVGLLDLGFTELLRLITG